MPRIREVCSFTGCGNLKSQGLHFFKFPKKQKDPERLDEWLEFCNNPMLAGNSLNFATVCQRHFTDDCFTNAEHKKLLAMAVPTLDGKILHDRVTQDSVMNDNEVGIPNLIALPCTPKSSSTFWTHFGHLA
jgi:hypothetical protein